MSRQEGSMGTEIIRPLDDKGSKPDVQKLTGFEFWFTPYSKKSSDLTSVISPPPRYRFIIAITITVILMTYVIMPLLTKLLRPWLFST